MQQINGSAIFKNPIFKRRARKRASPKVLKGENYHNILKLVAAHFSIDHCNYFNYQRFALLTLESILRGATSRKIASRPFGNSNSDRQWTDYGLRKVFCRSHHFSQAPAS